LIEIEDHVTSQATRNNSNNNSNYNNNNNKKKTVAFQCDCLTASPC